MLDFERYEVMTFDCYGTLIDWEPGIIDAVNGILRAHGLELSGEKILKIYAALESRAEAREFKNYKSVLRAVVEGMAIILKFEPSEEELGRLHESLKQWEPFPDTVEALKALGRRFKLAVISNVDDDLFAFTNERLGIDFDWVVTSEQVRAYKPSLQNFRDALEKIGVRRDGVVHVAESLYHDIAPAKELGLTTVWINRRGGYEGNGATPRAYAEPDLEVPDLSALVELIGD